MNAQRIATSGRQLVARLLLWMLRTFVDRDLDVRRHSVIISPATYSPWLQDRAFLDVYDKVKDYTLVDRFRCYELWYLLGQTRQLEGDVIEVGAWRGGSGCLLAKRASDLGFSASVYLCDTFGGVVKATNRDSGYCGGEHSNATAAQVLELAKLLDVRNVEVCQGVFPEDTGPALARCTFRFCHIDVDVYQSGKDVLHWVWPRLAVAGIVVFDDFGFSGCPGIAELVHEEEQKSDRICLQNLNGHAVFIKVS